MQLYVQSSATGWTEAGSKQSATKFDEKLFPNSGHEVGEEQGQKKNIIPFALYSKKKEKTGKWGAVWVDWF